MIEGRADLSRKHAGSLARRASANAFRIRNLIQLLAKKIDQVLRNVSSFRSA